MISPRNVDLYTTCGPRAEAQTAEPLDCDVVELNDDTFSVKENACSNFARHVHARKKACVKSAKVSARFFLQRKYLHGHTTGCW